MEKPDTESAPSNLAVIGRYVLDPAVFDVLRIRRPDAATRSSSLTP